MCQQAPGAGRPGPHNASAAGEPGTVDPVARLEPVQTFLPYPDFAETAAVLDSARLGKQRVETLQILRAVVLPEYGWQHHPAVLMWRGRVPALVAYGLACVAGWRELGHADSTA